MVRHIMASHVAQDLNARKQGTQLNILILSNMQQNPSPNSSWKRQNGIT